MGKELNKMDQFRKESSKTTRIYLKIKIGSKKAKFQNLMINQVVELVGLSVQHQL
jgi:hypothetical protein